MIWFIPLAAAGGAALSWAGTTFTASSVADSMQSGGPLVNVGNQTNQGDIKQVLLIGAAAAAALYWYQKKR